MIGTRVYRESRRSRTGLIVFLAVWIASVSLGLGGLAVYSQAEGEIRVPPEGEDAGFDLAPDRHTLVMAIHPKCPCTGASVYELERLLNRCANRVHCVIVAYTPHAGSEESDGWEGTDPFAISHRISDAEIIWDAGGDIARHLGCLTSGSVVLYDEDGNPEFWGGLTTGRSHAGDNLGSDSILALVQGRKSPKQMTPVYGCPLTSASDCPNDLCGGGACGQP